MTATLEIRKPAGTLWTTVTCTCGDVWRYQATGFASHDVGAVDLILSYHDCAGKPFDWLESIPIVACGVNRKRFFATLSPSAHH